MIKKLMAIFNKGRQIKSDPTYKESKLAGIRERQKVGKRTDIINHLLTITSHQNYLEIGVRNPDDNFNKINCKNKYSVDPGLENEKNLATFPFTSDVFFEKLLNNQLSSISNIKFDVIFIDGLHLAEQVDRDIANCLNIIKEDGFIVLHDCNPPDEYYAREDYSYANGPSGSFWNGTTWKAFYKARHMNDIFSCCVDCDWGVGIITKRIDFTLFNNLSVLDNPFYEFSKLKLNREKHLNLITFEDLYTLK